jgi:pimeloyl-ACP methyl ester carboxylesterase
MFRRLISRLSDRFHCVAPDLPGFGYTQAPPGEFEYTFEHLASVTAGFVDAVGLEQFSLYVFDFAAPVGLRIATTQPERIEALIVQNGNLYTEGLSDQTQPLQNYWRDGRATNTRSAAF